MKLFQGSLKQNGNEVSLLSSSIKGIKGETKDAVIIYLGTTEDLKSETLLYGFMYQFYGAMIIMQEDDDEENAPGHVFVIMNNGVSFELRFKASELTDHSVLGTKIFCKSEKFATKEHVQVIQKFLDHINHSQRRNWKLVPFLGYDGTKPRMETSTDNLWECVPVVSKDWWKKFYDILPKDKCHLAFSPVDKDNETAAMLLHLVMISITEELSGGYSDTVFIVNKMEEYPDTIFIGTVNAGPLPREYNNNSDIVEEFFLKDSLCVCSFKEISNASRQAILETCAFFG